MKSRVQTEETWPDQISRLQAMTDPRQEKWDLSANDVAAIAAVLRRLEELRWLVLGADEAFSNAVAPVEGSNDPLEAWRFNALRALKDSK